MAIKIKDVTNCCVAAELYDFGGSQNRDSETEQDKTKMLNTLAKHGRDFRLMGYDLTKLAVVTAYITTAQTLAEEALKEAGFEPSREFTKSKHLESNLRVWMMAAPDFAKWSAEYLNKGKVRGTAILGSTSIPPMPVAQAVAGPVDWDENFEEEDM